MRPRFPRCDSAHRQQIQGGAVRWPARPAVRGAWRIHRRDELLFWKIALTMTVNFLDPIDSQKMRNHMTAFIALITTRLQPGSKGVRPAEPFQRLPRAGKTVETVLTFLTGWHRTEARCQWVIRLCKIRSEEH